VHPIRKSRVLVWSALMPAVAGVALAGGVAWATAAQTNGAAPEPVPDPTRTIVGTVWTIDTENSSFVLRDEKDAHHIVRTDENTKYFVGEDEAERDRVIVLDARVSAVLSGTGGSEVATRVTREVPEPDAPAVGG
jgi:hypothetical protein